MEYDFRDSPRCCYFEELTTGDCFQYSGNDVYLIIGSDNASDKNYAVNLRTGIVDIFSPLANVYPVKAVVTCYDAYFNSERKV